MSWIEAIPNVSEGRDVSTVAKLGDALSGRGVRVLDTHSDPSHHRSVITAVCPFDAIGSLMDGCARLARHSVEAIDVHGHDGVHPRIGSLDVLPFVALADSSPALLDALVEAARDTASRIASELSLPVFLYGAASPSPVPPTLAALRRGGTAGLAERLARKEMRPDFGPLTLHPRGGATAIGVRDLLVAYNVALDTTDLACARRIAAAIRERDGGLPGVQALGMPLPHRGLVQVSMNLLDLRQSSLRTVYRAVEEHAGSLGVGVDHSEIVGLVPGFATYEGMREELRLERDPPVIEERMAQAGLPVPRLT